MSNAVEHYRRLLAPYYTDMFGDFDAKVAEQRALLERLGISAPGAASRALDLGCGSGFQSVALAELGFRVRAVDLCEALLAQLEARARGLAIEVVRGDMREVARLADPGTDVAVCMGDSLLHLESLPDVDHMLSGVLDRLAAGGRLVLTFRDLTTELRDLDRFIALRSTDSTILTCFLEYEPQTVKVHDLVHVRQDGQWTLRKGFYRKLRLGARDVAARLQTAGFRVEHEATAAGLVTLVAGKPGPAGPR